MAAAFLGVEHFRAEAIAPVQNKIGKALIEPRLRNVLAQPSSTIMPLRLMDEGAIVICICRKAGSGRGSPICSAFDSLGIGKRRFTLSIAPVSV
jgi:hypothetical protein